jgi:Secretion system C-terminal sorting domain
MKKCILTISFIALSIVFSVFAFAQNTVNVVSDLTGSTEGNLNAAVQAAVTAGTLSNTVFQLEPYGYYILNGTINVPAGQTLTIVAPTPGTTQATAPPQIVWSVSGGLNYQYNIDCYGSISLKNIWLMYSTTVGDQTGSSLTIEDDPLAVNGQHGTFEGCIFDYSQCPGSAASGAVGVASSHFIGSFKNCYFKNCIDKHLRYYGRALSFPYNTTGWHSDSVTFENCTFANMGYVYMQEGGEYADYVKFNHCTFLDVVVFPLESGWWNKLSVTNCLFVNCNMFGDIPALRGSGDINGGTLRIDSISTFGFVPITPFTEQQRQILFTNSSYFLDPWLVDWMQNCPYSVSKHSTRDDDLIPQPMPMLSPGTLRFFDTSNASQGKIFPLMNAAHLDSSSNPGFLVPTTDTVMLKVFMNLKWDTNKDTSWAWRASNDINALWPVAENLAYSNTTLKTAGMGGFPLGDLYHWWPTQYTAWTAQVTAENDTINKWLSLGFSSTVGVSKQPGIPGKFALTQNYPNPFNPTTQINYSVPLRGFVSLKVYNLLGQEVATLINDVQSAGNYVATFNGAGFASGVYLYQLQSGSISITKKFVLLK